MENDNSVCAKFYTFTNEIRNSQLQSVRETRSRIFTGPILAPNGVIVLPRLNRFPVTSKFQLLSSTSLPEFPPIK